jgi:hypothetical protein
MQLFGTKNSDTFTVGNHFESKSARYALLCKAVWLLFVMILLKNSPPIPRRFCTAVPPFRRTLAGFDAADKLLLPARNKQILPGLP